MNRLFTKLKDFGLIFSVTPDDETEIIDISKSLKKADIPVALFPFTKKQKLNSIKISNGSEDMFLGALCSPTMDCINESISSGAHFIICEHIEKEIILKCLSTGIDLIVSADTIEDIDKAIEYKADAIVINTENTGYNSLISHVLKKNELPFFLRGTAENIPFDKMRNEPSLVAFIIEYPHDKLSDVFTESHKILHRMLGLKFETLSLTTDSYKIEEAKMFSALSAIALASDSDRDLLTIGVKDMDRTIAYFKWKNIYIDPLSAKMDNSVILETELYNDFLGWPVKLINRG